MLHHLICGAFERFISSGPVRSFRPPTGVFIINQRTACCTNTHAHSHAHQSSGTHTYARLWLLAKKKKWGKTAHLQLNWTLGWGWLMNRTC